MLIPFCDDHQGNGVFEVIHSLTEFLSKSLGQKLNDCQGLGGYTNSWKAFQLELALEQMFLGNVPIHPPVPTASALEWIPHIPIV